MADTWVKTQQEHRRELKRRMRMMEAAESIEKQEKRLRRKRMNKAQGIVSSKQARRRLKTNKRRREMREFRKEARNRQGEGYSVSQMLVSHVCSIGQRTNISQKEVSQYLKRKVSFQTLRWGEQSSAFLYCCCVFFCSLFLFVVVLSFPLPPSDREDIFY